MTRTTWHVETENIGGLRHLKFTVETEDPEIVKVVEAAAERAGVEMIRELTGETKEEV